MLIEETLTINGPLQVCALLNGAGYAEQVAVSAKMVLPVPSNVPLTHAASLPEAAHNAWKVISEAQLVRGRKLLVILDSPYHVMS